MRLLLGAVIIAFLASCNSMNYKKTKSGLLYKIFPANTSKDSTKDGYVLKLNQQVKFNDSILFTTYGKAPQYAQVQPITDPAAYSPAEIFSMLKKGDSAVTVMLVDTLLKRGYASQLPPNAKKGDKITISFKVLEIFTVDSLARADMEMERKKDEPRARKEMEEQQAKMKKMQEDAEKKEYDALVKSGEVDKELKEIETYLAAKKITAQKTGKGTYVYIEKQGTGPQVENGKFANVKYTGRHMDTDSIFDAGTYPLQVGVGNAIKGWHEGLPLFKEGGKGKIFIPGFLAYGKNEGGGYPFRAYEPLMFDVEILSVTDTMPRPQMKMPRK